MDAAIAADDICWHALPFNLQTELMDRSQVIGPALWKDHYRSSVRYAVSFCVVDVSANKAIRVAAVEPYQKEKG